ncbi:MAG: hypothetical protein RL518_2090 [Pseudomonadota bacterium]|jgi:hypothetical protein
MSLATWRSLSPRDRALVAVAVLIDGADSKMYLECDAEKSELFKRAADELSSLEVDARVAFVGTVLRLALEEGE